MTGTSSDGLRGRGGDAGLAAVVLAPLDARPGPARRLSSAASAAFVDAVLAAAVDGAEPPVVERAPPVHALPTPPPEPPRPRPAPAADGWRRRAGLAAAAGLVLFGGSGASALAWRLLRVELGDPEAVPPAPPIRVERRQPARASGRPPAEDVLVPPAIVAPQPEALGRPAAARRSHAEPAAPQVAPAPAPAPVVVPENLPPEDLLASANERRQRKAWGEADAFYGAVVGRFPGTDAAIVAEVASAALRLQHLGDVAGALEGYRRTLASRPTGPLAEEARWGVAEAHRALGDVRAEGEAPREFLARHPQSALAPAAQRRLSRLSP